MGRNVWNAIKQSKNFYVRIYRATIDLMALSFSINLLLSVGIIYTVLHKPPIDFYATNSERNPMPLQSMEHPNYSPQALLGEEVENDIPPQTNPRALTP